MNIKIPTGKPFSQEWISVKDRLPESYYEEEVLYWDSRCRLIEMGSWDPKIRAWKCVNGRIDSADRVTHWMPLPEDPQ